MGFTPLHLATANGNDDTVQALLEAGAPVDAVCDEGLTPLLAASQHGYTSTCRLLCEHGADVERQASHGVRAIHLAAAEGHTETVQALLEAGADADRPTDEGYTPLEFAALHGRVATASLLCAHGAAHGDALEIAAENEQKAMVDFLAAAAKLEELITPLHWLEETPPERALDLLRDGADLHACRAPGGPTPHSLARAAAARGEAPDGSTAWHVLRAAEPWSPESHNYFPKAARDAAADLALLGRSLCRQRPCLAGHEMAMLDVWDAVVLPHAVTREAAA